MLTLKPISSKQNIDKTDHRETILITELYAHDSDLCTSTETQGHAEEDDSQWFRVC